MENSAYRAKSAYHNHATFIIRVIVSFNRADDLNYCQVIALVGGGEEVIARIVFPYLFHPP